MKLEIFSREKVGKGANRKLQTSGKVPAVLYGAKENINLAVSQSAINALFLATSGKPQMLDLALENAIMKKAIIQDYQYNRIKNKFIHVDFLEVSENTIVHLDIPVRTKGESVVSKMGGVAQVVRHEIPVSCKAKDIPSHIEVDINELNFGDSIHVLDIEYPKGVKPVVTGRNFTIVSTSAIKEEEETTEETAKVVEEEPTKTEEVDKESKK